MKIRAISVIALIIIINIALAGCALPDKEKETPVKKTDTEGGQATLLEPKVSSVAVEEEKVEVDPVSANGNEKIIVSGRWFFSAHNMKEGYIDYYDKHANYLGRIQLANE